MHITRQMSLFLGAAVPPWVGYNEEETIQHQILALSAVRTLQKMFIFILKNKKKNLQYNDIKS